MTPPSLSDRNAARPQATLADWCALHRMAPPQILHWLAQTPPPPQKQSTAPPDVTAPAQTIWHHSARAMARALPAQARAIKAARDGTQVQTAPDVARFPQAFTLHDGGNGQPYVSVPYTGTARDMLTLAHEFGHAVQITHTAPPLTPPVLREVCAFLAEHWLLDHLALVDARLAQAIAAPWARSVAVDQGARMQDLITACAAPDTAYEYAWNYPLARLLALRAAQVLDPADQWQLFTGGWSIGALAQALDL